MIENKLQTGFTLIEMSIVLVIIGLIIGGILTGRDLIDAASQRAQISQIEKYNTAVRTFQSKYGYLPGDIPNPYAASFGFQSRGSYPGEGDGNGLIDDNCNNTSGTANVSGIRNGCGENAVFWEDLSGAGLIDAGISGIDISGANYPAINGGITGQITMASTPGVKNWLPPGKIGNGTFMYVYSLGGFNYFSVSTVTSIQWDLISSGNPGLTVQQAYNIDTKVDDGLPQSGNVNACYINYGVSEGDVFYSAGGGQQGMSGYNGTMGFCVPNPGATTYASTNCYDNNGTAGTQKYSLTKNASVQNCALSFKFQ